MGASCAPSESTCFSVATIALAHGRQIIADTVRGGFASRRSTVTIDGSSSGSKQRRQETISGSDMRHSFGCSPAPGHPAGIAVSVGAFARASASARSSMRSRTR